MGIKVTGNSRIDTATAEIARHIRDARVGLRYREQDHYDEAMRLRDEIMAGTREQEHRYPPWRPANNGTGRRIWFLTRGYGTESDSVPLADRYHYNAAGHAIRYASVETAQAAADKLNGAGK